MKEMKHPQKIEGTRAIILPQNWNRLKWRTHLLTFVMIVATFSIIHGSRVIESYSRFHGEDVQIISHTITKIHSFGDCFVKRSLNPGLYRPLTTNVYYYYGGILFDNDLRIYKTINIIVYLANGFLFYLICLNFLQRWWSVLAALFFVSRFSHIKTVCNSVEFQNLLSTFLILLAFQLFLIYRQKQARWIGGLSLVSFILALFSKETAIVYPLLLITLWWLFDDTRVWLSYLAPIVCVAIWIILFIWVFRDISEHELVKYSFDFSYGNMTKHYADYLFLFLNLHVYPPWDYIVRTNPSILKSAESVPVTIAFTIVLVINGVFVLFHKKIEKYKYLIAERVFAFGFIWFLITTAPYAFFGGRIFLRYSYIGHAGLALCCAVVIREIVLMTKRRLSHQEDFTSAI